MSAGTGPAKAAAPPSAPVAAGGAKTTPAKQQKATPAKRAAPEEVVVIGDSDDDDEMVVAPKRARVAAAGVSSAPVRDIRPSDALTLPRPHLSGGGDALTCQEAGAPARVQPEVRQEGRNAEALISAAHVRPYMGSSVRTGARADAPLGGAHST